MSEETPTRPARDWGEWTPGRGVERIRTEMPGVMPDLTEEDHAAAEAIIATAVSDDDAGEPVGSAPLSEEPAHPEADCHLCGGPNIAWSAPSPLWNQVMRGGSINGEDLHNGIVCPVCFATLAEAAGVADLWMFSAKRVHVELETVTPSGRVWDEAAWLWREPGEAEVLHKAAEGLRVYAATPHASRCACGINDAGQRFVDPICRGQ